MKKSKKSFRCNSKVGLGIHSEFLKTRIKNRNCFHGTLDLPKPYNAAELALLSKFIFGKELSVRFEYCQDLFKETLDEAYLGKKNIALARYLKLSALSKKDYVLRPSTGYARCRHDWDNGKKVDKMILVYLRYFCNEKHSDFYDHKFSYEVFNSSYDVDDYFWRHCIGELSCGGIAGSSYGQVEITSFKERERIMNLFTNKDDQVRESFRKELDILIEMDKQYDTE